MKKHVSVLAIAFILAGCGEGVSVSPASTPASNDVEPTSAVEDAVETVNEEGTADEQTTDITEVETEQTAEDATYSENDTDLFIGASVAIDALASWDSYSSVKTSEHIVHTNPDNSYSYKETLHYVKQPLASHYIYESHNPQYMEIYANEADGMFANDSENAPNWTYTLDADTIAMWQEEPLPDTLALLQAIAEEHTKFTVINADTNTVEYFVQTPTTAIDTLLFGEDSTFHMLKDVMLTVTYREDELEHYEIVGNYMTEDDDEGQFIVEEQFKEVNNLQSVRVPEDVKAAAILEEDEIEWNE